MSNDPVIPFITVPDDVPEYEPEEEPGDDFPAAEEEPDPGYRELLDESQRALRDVTHSLHEYMMALPDGGASERWKEMYILTMHLHAIANTIDILKRHVYPPF